ncbi:MAG: ABC transporter ATP-binding protein [Deltaproteobacteria bacterium]|nr:ABC transporter ATP-binding protein [Deltaproteobacteria bacterium]
MDNKTDIKRRRPPAGGPGPRHQMIESAKNVKGAFKRLFAYFGAQKIPLGVSALIIFVSVFLSVAGPAVLGNAITNYLEREQNLSLFLKQVLILLIIYAAAWVTEAFTRIILIKVSNNIIFRMRQDAFNHIQGLSMSYFDTEDIGEIMSRLTNDIEAIEQGVNNVFSEGLRGLLSVIMTLSAMLMLNVRFTLIVIATIPLMAFVAAVIGIKVRKAFRVNQQKIADLSTKVEESVSGVKVIKTFGMEREEIKDFDRVSIEARDAGTIAEMLSHVFFPVMQLITSVILALIVGIGGYLVLGNSAVFSIGLLTSFIMYSRNFLWPIAQISGIYNVIQSALAGAERVFEILDTKPVIIEKPDPVPFKEGDIVFSHVHFAYEEGKKVLEDINLTVPLGSAIAIVGPTGAGKTTMINLLNRFYDVKNGSITINGTDIRDMKINTLRSALGVVLQEPFFFATTIRENLLYGNQDASEEEMLEAAKLANASHFISRLPNGYDTVLTERGLNISQGERQLLGITRAILRNPSILILDEATSSIDSLIEAQIQEALLTLMKGRTCLTIAHRLSTIKNADRIIVIHNHRIIEEGTYDELTARNGFYAHLYALQQNQENITEDMFE